MILLNTGLRPGRELLEMKWCHLSEFVEGKGKEQVIYLTMQVNHGKTGQREVVAGATCRNYFENIKKRFDHLRNLPFDRLTKVDEHIFRLPDGTRPKDLHGAFNRVLERCGLKLDPRTRGKRTLYSLRHTYATHMLVKHPNIHLIAKNMGTSIEMLERHYSHAEVRRGAKHLAQTDFRIRSRFSRPEVTVSETSMQYLGHDKREPKGKAETIAHEPSKVVKDPLNIDPGF